MNSNTENIFTEDYQSIPYWWKDRPDWFKGNFPTIPNEVDVVIIGSGFTGLNAGLQTARAGLKTLILDQKEIGWGCSSRNGGQISNSVKPSFNTLSRRYGAEIAKAIIDEGDESVQYMHSLVTEENFNCQLLNVGRFHGAHNPKMYEMLAKDSTSSLPNEKSESFMIPRSEMKSELDTDVYFGGAIYPNHCSIDVGKYLSQLANLVKSTGATLIGNCHISNFHRTKNGFQLETDLGTVDAKKMIVATNGYTGKLTPWYQRRIMPIGSYIIATEPIEEKIIDRLMPKNRVLSDTRKLVYYYRAMPNRDGILFGGRVSLYEIEPEKSAISLRNELIRIFPELSDVKISRSWMGFVGYTFDKLMHCCSDNGLYFAGGYCGSGVAMASYLGMRLGRQAAELDNKGSVFHSIPFPTRPYYFGKPWFLAPSVLFYRITDRLGFLGRSKR